MFIDPPPPLPVETTLSSYPLRPKTIVYALPLCCQTREALYSMHTVHAHYMLITALNLLT